MSELTLTVWVFGAGLQSARGAVVHLDSQSKGIGVLDYVQFTIYAGVDYYVRTELTGWKTNIRVMAGRSVSTNIYITLCSPNGDYIEVYRDRDIIFDHGTGYYLVHLGSKQYDKLTSVDEARAAIDTELGPIQPTPPVIPIPPTPTPTPTPIEPGEGFDTSILGWFKPIADFLTWLGTSFSYWIITPISNKLSEITGSVDKNSEQLKDVHGDLLRGFPIVEEGHNVVVDAFMGAFKTVTDALIQPLTDSGTTAVNEATSAMSQHSPDPKLKAAIEEMVKTLNDQQGEIAKQVHHSPGDPNAAPGSAATLTAQLLGVSVSVAIAGALIDILHPIKGVGALEIAKGIIDSVGIPSVASELMGMPARLGILPELTHYYNALYQPMIPGSGELTNMRVKEKISQADFETYLGYQGFSKDWATKIWDAHFQAPTLSDILTAWRRGIIDEPRVDELMTLIDLDPFYKQIFDTRKYVTPSISITRFMFETGAINADQVRANVRLEGYSPEYVDAITNFITNFQARRWRTRYLGSLATGYVKGVRTADQVRQATLEAGYTEDVAKWLIESSNVRMDIEKLKGTGAGTKLLSVGELKRLYSKNHISADQLRTELMVRGYSLGDVQLLITMLDEEKVVVSAGGTKVALSVPELLNAMRYGLMTEDAVSTELQLRGLSLQEVQILIATKKAQWGMGET